MPGMKNEQRRALIVKLFLQIASSIADAYLNDQQYGSRADEVILCCCIFLGQAERRPMNASELAAYSGIPRTTVLRKLVSLIALGVISKRSDGRFTLVTIRNTSALDAVQQHIHRTNAALSEMGTK